MTVNPNKSEGSKVSQGTAAPINPPPKELVELVQKIKNSITQQRLSPGTVSSDSASLEARSDDSIPSKGTGTLKETNEERDKRRAENIKNIEAQRDLKMAEKYAPKNLEKTKTVSPTLSAQAIEAIDKKVIFLQKIKKGNIKEISSTSITKKQNNFSSLSRISNLFTRSLPTQKLSSVVPLNQKKANNISGE